MRHHECVDGASESEAERIRKKHDGDLDLRHDAKRHRNRIRKNNEINRVREVRNVKAGKQGQPQAREPSCNAGEALRIECRWQERLHITNRNDFRAREILDAGDCLEKIRWERVDCLQMSAVNQQRSLVELRKRGTPALLEV